MQVSCGPNTGARRHDDCVTCGPAYYTHVQYMCVSRVQSCDKWNKYINFDANIIVTYNNHVRVFFYQLPRLCLLSNNNSVDLVYSEFKHYQCFFGAECEYIEKQNPSNSPALSAGA